MGHTKSRKEELQQVLSDVLSKGVIDAMQNHCVAGSNGSKLFLKAELHMQQSRNLVTSHSWCEKPFNLALKTRRRCFFSRQSVEFSSSLH